MRRSEAAVALIRRGQDDQPLWLARRYYQDGLAIAQRLAVAAPENADYARSLSISYERLGDLAKSLGDAAEAGQHYEDGLAIAQRLAGAAPENAVFARNL